MKEKKTKRIGIFGGTFNPPHLGHLIVAERIAESLALEKVFFIPSFISPHKKAGEESLAGHRLKMVQRAIQGNPLFASSDIEIKKEGMSYTYATVEHFYRKYAGSQLFLIIGADNFFEFNTWKYPDRILAKSALIVMNRPSHTLPTDRLFDGDVRFVSVPDIEISSTDIRHRVKLGRSFRHLVPESVRRYIIEHRLYK